MSTIIQMETFQTLLTERFNNFANVIFQDVTLMIKAYQEENDRLRSLLNNATASVRNSAKIDHNISAGPTLAVKQQPPDLNIPGVETGAAHCAKRPKMEHTKQLANVKEEEKSSVLQQFSNTTKEEQLEVPVSFAKEVPEPSTGMTAVEQTGLSQPSEFAGSVQLNLIPNQQETKVSKQLAKEPIDWKIAYDRSLVGTQKSGTITMRLSDVIKRDLKSGMTTLQAKASGDFYTAVEFLQPSTSGEVGKQDLPIPEPPKLSSQENAMNCSYCGANLQEYQAYCTSCGKSTAVLFDVNQTSSHEVRTRQRALASFLSFRRLKKEEKMSGIKKKTVPRNDNTVKISIGLMIPTDGMLKPVRGMVLPLAVNPGSDVEQLLRAAEKRLTDFNRNFEGGPYLLVYPDGTKVTSIPGTEKPFSLKDYKEAVGKAYQRVTLYLCTADDYNEINNCD
ncbi:uncharacterized protein LOC130922294 isoform X2 [Corythoichthys intestinalis]|uniref:uncharacterized protein LOC130922294 isoform X2 n=1 Tax=Corythoichthys intestinalis TaxID=161448 RepID=UPI0025A545EA|nr:uncharacterized protein LOC130922294 isoform X2 [Corythoichthys intestinalis]